MSAKSHNVNVEGKLYVGAAEVDITPPVGTPLAGSLVPRPSIGIEDPLTFKAVALESNGSSLVYVLADLISLPRSIGDAAVALASERTGIPAERIVWAASHTHTGPYTGISNENTVADWLNGLPQLFAEAVDSAWRSRRPAAFSFQRDYCYTVGHNRRLRFKDGREINTWLLNKGEEEVQCLGSAAPIDPELGILCFDDEQGHPIAVIWQYTLHANSNFGRSFSADYPAVVAARLQERFGRQLISLYLPGACGDLNRAIPGQPAQGYRHVGDELARVMIPRLDKRQPQAGPLPLGSVKTEVAAACRECSPNQRQRIIDSQWPPELQELFQRQLDVMSAREEHEVMALIQAWHIGHVGFASLPGEIFVQHGLHIKAESPFQWTFPVELGGDCLGYLITDQAEQAGGYEALISLSSPCSARGVEAMVQTALEQLKVLYEDYRRQTCQ